MKKADKTEDKVRGGVPFKKGDDPRRNLDGRPKGSYSLVTILKKKLAKAIKKGGKEAGEELVDIWISKAKTDRDFNALKEIVRYTDGMPKEQIEHSGEIITKVDPEQVKEFIKWRKSKK